MKVRYKTIYIILTVLTIVIVGAFVIFIKKNVEGLDGGYIEQSYATNSKNTAVQNVSISIQKGMPPMSAQAGNVANHLTNFMMDFRDIVIKYEPYIDNYKKLSQQEQEDVQGYLMSRASVMSDFIRIQGKMS